MYDEMALTMLLWGLLGFINNHIFPGSICTGLEVEHPMSYLTSRGWPDDLTTLLLWENAFQ